MVSRKFNYLWKEAKKFIPGGNMLLSKRPEMFSPKMWPAHFLKVKVVMFGILQIKNT